MGTHCAGLLPQSPGWISQRRAVSDVAGPRGALHVRVPSHKPLPQLPLHHP